MLNFRLIIVNIIAGSGVKIGPGTITKAGKRRTGAKKIKAETGPEAAPRKIRTVPITARIKTSKLMGMTRIKKMTLRIRRRNPRTTMRTIKIILIGVTRETTGRATGTAGATGIIGAVIDKSMSWMLGEMSYDI